MYDHQLRLDYYIAQSLCHVVVFLFPFVVVVIIGILSPRRRIGYNIQRRHVAMTSTYYGRLFSLSKLAEPASPTRRSRLRLYTGFAGYANSPASPTGQYYTCRKRQAGSSRRKRHHPSDRHSLYVLTIWDVLGFDRCESSVG